MKRALMYACLPAAMALSACAHRPTPMPEAAAQPAPPAPVVPDQSFVQAAGGTDLFEIKAGTLAADKARRPAVKAFAAHTKDGHTDTTQKLMAIVQGKGATPPAPQLSADQQAMVDALSNETGPRFDHDYLADQIAVHEAAVTAFKDEIANGTDPDVKAFAQATLPVVQQHLEEARKLEGGHPAGARHMRHHHKG